MIVCVESYYLLLPKLHTPRDFFSVRRWFYAKSLFHWPWWTWKTFSVRSRMLLQTFSVIEAHSLSLLIGAANWFKGWQSSNILLFEVRGNIMYWGMGIFGFRCSADFWQRKKWLPWVFQSWKGWFGCLWNLLVECLRGYLDPWFAREKRRFYFALGTFLKFLLQFQRFVHTIVQFQWPFCLFLWKRPRCFKVQRSPKTYLRHSRILLYS